MLELALTFVLGLPNVMAPAPAWDIDYTPTDKVVVSPEWLDPWSACDNPKDCAQKAIDDCAKYNVGVESSTWSDINAKPCQWTCKAPCDNCPQQGGAIKKENCNFIPKPIPKPEA